MRKSNLGIILTFGLILMGCASGVSIPEKGYYWVIYEPKIPKDVPAETYAKLWDINVRTINAGKYDFDAYNSGVSGWIDFNKIAESALSEDFSFAGVCANYADYFIFLLKQDDVLLELYNRGVISENYSPSHKWIEYRTTKNRYIIDPTWCDSDFVGEPVGMYANNARFAADCVSSSAGNALIEAKSKEWFFRDVKTVTRAFDRRAHGL